MRHQVAIGLGSLLLATPAYAEVLAVTPDSFDIEQSVTIDQPLPRVWDMLRNPQKWWDKAHTYSENSANLYLDGQATGCFCERLPGGGSVAHAQILYIQPPRMIRLSGALGPLQAEAVIGTLTFTLEAEGQGATRVTVSYVVGGHIRGGAEAMAPTVDEVLAVQLIGLKSAAEAGLPAPPAAPADR
ncbi:SRPBCC domain-containing protein [Sphingomonas sp. 28-63-12]|uniref:SRPBCC family protein n=1 Tax=Sphingomonas sp. 28-63-12 TaxID=1970434 RepID=UPI000BD53390|nr:MAG: hypothetical protein B7Y47_02035 [Sphingomonas sp. 28-63-12]